MVELVDIRCECPECDCQRIVTVEWFNNDDVYDELVLCDECIDGIHEEPEGGI
jgi:hypothetical protein